MQASRKYTQAKTFVPAEYETEFSELLDNMGIWYTTENDADGVEFTYGINIGSREDKKIRRYLDSIF